MKRIIFLLVAISLISCKQEVEKNDDASKEADSLSLEQKLKIDSPQFALEADAKQYASNWVEFITAQNEVRKLENSSVKEVMNNAGTIAKIMQSLKTSLPDSLKAVPVEARLNVINTKAKLLDQYSSKNRPVAEDVIRTSKELHLEFNNLKLQLNELFLKSLEDFEKELDEFEEMEKEMDSLNTSKKTEKVVS